MTIANSPAAEEQVRFLLNLQRLLEEGSFVATYKHALLLSLADVCVEKGDNSGGKLRVSTHELAENLSPTTGSVFRDDDKTWAASILRGLHEAPGNNQREPLAARVEEFLSELSQMGPTERESHLRYSMNARAEAVVLVIGDSKTDRDAVFSGFNTPLLPDILVCTQVGQEGIDLHRQCSHVIHYDLGWNPATLEQRTGRADRIGSKAFRERRLAADYLKQLGHEPDEAHLPGLDVALPYLAGTYDERMFDRLRSRSQAFEILTGGDPTAERDSETSWLGSDDVVQEDGIDYVPLPVDMLDRLRVNLGVTSRISFNQGSHAGSSAPPLV